MRSSYLVTGLVLVLAVVTGVLIYQGNQTRSASSSDVTVTETTSAAETATSDPYGRDTEAPSESATPAAPSGDRPATNVPMTKLAPGDKAPQFIIFSFDGAGSHQRWNEFMEAADADQLTVHRVPLRHLPARRFGEGRRRLHRSRSRHRQGIHRVRRPGVGHRHRGQRPEPGLLQGMEIGTHYNGHFCDDNLPGGNQWNTADWNNELDQFFTFMTDWKTLNGYTDAPDLQVPTDSIKGGRTPCLDRQSGCADPGLENAQHDLRLLDARPEERHLWPENVDGIWEFYMPQVYSPGFREHDDGDGLQLLGKFNGAKEEPETAPELRDIVKKTYDFMWDQAYNGNRAPILIANHFNKWNGDSFNPVAMDFMKEKCGQPDTYCATYQDVIAWMELQDPGVLAELQAQAPVAGTAP